MVPSATIPSARPDSQRTLVRWDDHATAGLNRRPTETEVSVLFAVVIGLLMALKALSDWRRRDRRPLDHPTVGDITRSQFVRTNPPEEGAVPTDVFAAEAYPTGGHAGVECSGLGEATGFAPPRPAPAAATVAALRRCVEPVDGLLFACLAAVRTSGAEPHEGGTLGARCLFLILRDAGPGVSGEVAEAVGRLPDGDRADGVIAVRDGEPWLGHLLQVAHPIYTRDERRFAHWMRVARAAYQ